MHVHLSPSFAGLLSARCAVAPLGGDATRWHQRARSMRRLRAGQVKVSRQHWRSGGCDTFVATRMHWWLDCGWVHGRNRSRGRGSRLVDPAPQQGRTKRICNPNGGQVSLICSAQKVKRERITPSTAWLVGHGRTRKQIHQPCPSPFTRNRLAIELFLIFCQSFQRQEHIIALFPWCSLERNCVLWLVSRACKVALPFLSHLSGSTFLAWRA